jgi:hypothetical protein
VKRLCLAVAPLLATVLFQSACENANAVGQFASASAQAVTQGSSILSDLSASCVREKTETDPRTGLNPPDTGSITQECKSYADQVSTLLVDSTALTNYFTAISQLASAGSTTAGTDPSGKSNSQNSGASNKPAAGRAGETPASPAVQDLGVAGDIFTFLGQLATDGFRTKHLDADVKNQHDHVDNVLKALIAAVQTNYLTRLTNEQTGIETFYGTLGRNAEPAALILIRDQRDQAVSLIASQRQKAQNFVKALQNIQSGNDKLMSMADLKAKNVPTLLQPFTAAISQLIPTLLQ